MAFKLDGALELSWKLKKRIQMSGLLDPEILI